MIKKQDSFNKALNEHMRGGDGIVEVLSLATKEELNNNGRLFGKITINPGCSIGFHVHENESELFYVLDGEAEYSDNGNIHTISAGELTICPPGTGHSVANKKEKTVTLMALIINK